LWVYHPKLNQFKKRGKEMTKRIHIPLNDCWYYKDMFEDSDIQYFDVSKYTKVNIPHSNHILPLSYFKETDYQKISTYVKTIKIEKLGDDQNVMLIFDGVMNYSEIYIDGQYIGNHHGGYTPFTFDITEFVKDFNEHRLLVKVDSTDRTDFPPYGFVVDYLTYGGIYREVTLELRPKQHIQNEFLQTTMIGNNQWQLDVSFEASSELDEATKVTFDAIHQDSQIHFEGNVEKFEGVYRFKVLTFAHIWNIDSPKLYQYVLKIERNNHLIDQVNGHFGFRYIKVDPDGFYLNGSKMKLIGLNRHQSYPYVGYAMPKRVQEKDADILKYELGVDIVRSSHYPPSKHFLNKCDEIGLLVFEELPGWQFIGDDNWKQYALQHLSAMILRDRNHPSIVIWGTRINESKDDHAFYTQSNQMAKQLDGSRPTAGVRNFANSELLEDIYTYNDFNHNGSNEALLDPKKVTKQKAPYFITEHNGHMFPTKKVDNESHRIDQALRHANVLEAMYRSKNTMGAIGWCMNDYNTHQDFGSGDMICHHGVMDMFRIPKYAASVYASQRNKLPILDVLSSLSIGEYSASNPYPIYIMTNCEYVKIFKNNEEIGTFYPDKTTYSHLPHPPIIVYDMIGDQIEKKEKFTKKDANRIKKIIFAYMKYGFNMPILYKVMMGSLMLKYKLDMDQATLIFGKYLGDWGNKATKYEFQGFINHELVKKVIKSPAIEANIKIVLDSHQLSSEDTYDATRALILCQDAFGNDLPYIYEPFRIYTNNLLEVIGPNEISLIGGSTAFWIKSVGLSGVGEVIIESERFGKFTYQIEIKSTSCMKQDS
jgi:beta-galactosidase